MARPDGRVEAGQRASRAFSARAWNRAQDAADIVLGSRPGLAAQAGQPRQYGIVVPCQIQSTTVEAKVGHWVSYQPLTIRPQNLGQSEVIKPQIRYLVGGVVSPVTFLDSLPLFPLGVIVGAAALPKVGETGFVDICISGPAVAFVVLRSNDGSGPYRIGYPRLRDDAETTANLRGVLEKNPCGHHLCLDNRGDGSTGNINYGVDGVTVRLANVIVNG